MKTNNFYKICIFLIMMSMSLSCVQDDNFKAPTPEDDGSTDPGPEIEANITVAEVKELLAGDHTELISDLILEAYVVSSDASGNFYKELYLQDHPSNPTAGIRLVLDSQDLYLTYDVGRKLFIHLEGLAIGKGNDDVITIGQASENEITGISEPVIQDYITKSGVVATIEGKPVLFSDITEEHVGMYISVSNTQLNINQLGLPFVEAEELFDTQRMLESCEEGISFPLETSAYANFSQLILPDAAGTVSGIVTKDYHGNDFVLVLNEADDLIYDGERCGPEVLDCGINIISGNSKVFLEDFEEITNEDDLIALGWININTKGFGERFEKSSYEDNNYIKITPHKTGENPMEAWLITPVINLDATTSEELSFNIETASGNGNNLTVLVTDNYTGDPETTQWKLLHIDIPVGASEDFSGFSSSVLANINCLTGNVRIAFRYKTESSDTSATYHIDNIRITGNQ